MPERTLAFRSISINMAFRQTSSESPAAESGPEEPAADNGAANGDAPDAPASALQDEQRYVTLLYGLLDEARLRSEQTLADIRAQGAPGGKGTSPPPNTKGASRSSITPNAACASAGPMTNNRQRCISAASACATTI